MLHKQASDLPHKIMDCVLKPNDFSCVLKQKRNPGSSLSVPGQQLQEPVIDQGAGAGMWQARNDLSVLFKAGRGGEGGGMETYPQREEAGTSVFPGNVEVGHLGVERMKQCRMSSFGLRVDCF